MSRKIDDREDTGVGKERTIKGQRISRKASVADALIVNLWQSIMYRLFDCNLSKIW